MVSEMVSCARCQAQVPYAQATWLRGADNQAAPIAVCPGCAQAIDARPRAGTAGGSLILALLAGLGAALVSSLVWFGIVVVTNYELGIIAIAVGWLVALAVMMGARNKRGFAVQAISVVCTLLAMALSEYLIVRHFAVQSPRLKGASIPLFLPPAMMLELIVLGIKGSPATLLFWGIAIVQAYALPIRARK